MSSFSALGIGLSFVFGCILLGLVAELYYILWWKKRIVNRDIENQYANFATEVSYVFCWKKPNPMNKSNPHQEVRNVTEAGNEEDFEQGIGKDSLVQKFGEEGVESELMRLHNLCGPPRFLFTIKEETKEDLESENGGNKSQRESRTRSLSDHLILTPLASPALKTYPLDCYSHHGFNPLFESFSEAEMNKVRASPPPTFKFLRDAEEKLMKRLTEEADIRVIRNKDSTVSAIEETEGSFLSFLTKSNERLLLPLPSSTSNIIFRPFDNKSCLQHSSM